MTREEAIKDLHHLILKLKQADGDDRVYEHYKEAIEALRTEPCEDCISRQEVLDKAKYWIAMQETKTGFIEKRGYFVDADNIKTLPSVQPAQKVGKWIEKHGTIVCSECGWYAPRIETGCLANRHLEYHKSRYCWNCGAKMVEPQESEGAE